MNTVSDKRDTNDQSRFFNARYKRLNIFGIYYFAVLFYCLPFVSLFLFILDQVTINRTAMLFWIIFLAGLAPCGIIGIIASLIGLIRSIKQKNKRNKVIGIALTALGLIGIAAGIFGILLIYVVVA